MSGGPGYQVEVSPLSVEFEKLNFSIDVNLNESDDRADFIAEDCKDPKEVTTSFFKDRSGRTKLLAVLCCSSNESEPNRAVISEIYRIAQKQVDTASSNDAVVRTDEALASEESTMLSPLYTGWKHSLLFECQCEQDNLIVEGVNLVKTIQYSNKEIRFYLDITARAIKAELALQDDISPIPQGIRPVTSTLGITAVLLAEPSNVDQDAEVEDDPDPLISRISLGLLALELGGGTVPQPPLPYDCDMLGLSQCRQAYHYGVQMVFSSTVSWNIRLVQPLVVKCSSIGGARAAVGATMVSLSISHSNAHPHPVLVTNITLHPGNSSLYVSDTTLSLSSFGRSMPGGSTDVIDMSRHVRWTYAMGTAPSLPLKLMPYETFSTVLQIDAGEDLRSRTFVSPVAVTAVVDTRAQDARQSEIGKNLWDLGPSVIAADAIWTTERVATVPADALRVDMSLRKSRYKVGAPLVVSLRVLNLSHEDRNLMLLMAKDENSGGSGQRTPKIKSHTVNTAVVSEVNGYTFGVWGLSGEDDGTARQNRDHELLAVDAALLLGDVKGQHSVEAELRFVPLREGTLDVPNLKLYDKTHGKWYNCIHCLKIVAADSDD